MIMSDINRVHMYMLGNVPIVTAHMRVNLHITSICSSNSHQKPRICLAGVEAWHRNGTGEARQNPSRGHGPPQKRKSGLDGWGKKWQLRTVFDRPENEKASLELSIY